MPRLHDNTRAARIEATEEDRFDFEEETAVMERIYGSFGSWCACDLPMSECEWHTGSREVTSLGAEGEEMSQSVASSHRLRPDRRAERCEAGASLARGPVPMPT